MKNVLLLGDSIRMLYQPKVKELLKGRANVYGPAENGRWSDYTLNSLRFWLPQLPDADIVHWNNGFWDIGDNYQEVPPTRPLKNTSAIWAALLRSCASSFPRTSRSWPR